MGGVNNGRVSSERIRGVVFDVDDTLCDSAAAFGAGLARALRAFIPDLPESRYAEALEMWRADEHHHYREYTRGECSFDEQRRRRANELHARFGGPHLDQSAYLRWRDLFWGTFESAWRACPDAAPCVDALVAAGVRVGALTNASEDVQSRKLAACGLSCVPLLVTMDTFGFGKPDPRVFREACRRLGLEPAETLYVGDEFDVDAQAACAAGMHGVWLDRPRWRIASRARAGEGPGAERVVRIESLAELPGIVGIAGRPNSPRA